MAYKFVPPGSRLVPDHIVRFPGGRIIFVECKSPGKMPRANQLRAQGFNVVVLDSKNLEMLF